MTSTKSEVDQAVLSARRAGATWSQMSLVERSTIIKTFVDISSQRSEEIAGLIAAETGRTITSATANVAMGLEYFTSYIEMADRYLAPDVVLLQETIRHTVHREPWGVVACIAPWNFPFLNIAWQCGQALLSGNTVVFKNSEEDPLFAELLKELIAESDLPEYVFQVVQGGAEVGQWLANADIDLLSFTGSTATGQKLAVAAAARLIPFVAELGGSAPCVVFEDANQDGLAEHIFTSRFANAGQTCDSLKRLIVHESLYETVLGKLLDLSAKIRVGDASDDATEMGPLVALSQLEKAEAQLAASVAMGAKIECGGARPAGFDGAYLSPTVVTNITREMLLWREEVFAPILPVVTFKTEEEAIALANDSALGLNAWVMTTDSERFKRVAAALQVGMVSENATGIWSAKSPFGGYKQSGVGRTNGAFGFHEMTQVKLIGSLR